jgi:hypothetical protein
VVLRTPLTLDPMEERASATLVTFTTLLNAYENGAAGLIRLARDGDTSQSLSVTVLMSGTAINGVDYSFIPMTITFAAGSSTADIVFSTTNDGNYEGTETITAALAGGGPYTIGSGHVTINLIDDDKPEVSVVKIADAAEGGATGTFQFSRTGNTDAPLSVTYFIGGTATAGDDYTQLSGTISFASGSSTAFLPIAAVNDTLAEFDETVDVSIADSASYTVDSRWATVTIHDNETPVVSVENRIDPLEGSQNGLFTFTRVGDTSQSLTINFTVSGTATSGTDYTSVGSSVTFNAGDPNAYVVVEALADSSFDPDETLTLTLGSGTGYTIGPGNTATLTIAESTPVISAETLWGASEDGAEGKFQLTRTGDLSQSLTVDLAISGTATGGTDYQAMSTQVTFGAGLAELDVAVVPIDDAVRDAGEVATITIQTSSQYVVGAANTATMAVTDNDTPLVWVSEPTQTKSEGTSGGITLVRAGGDTSQSLTVNVGIGADGQSDPLATWNTDYTLGASGVTGGSISLVATGGTVSFDANSTEVFIPLQALTDALAEDIEGLRFAVLADPSTPPAYLPGSGPVVGTGPGGSATADIWITQAGPVTGQLGLVRTDGSESAVGWVAENNDNDNYNFYGDPDTSLDQKFDKDELGQVVGENDLVALHIHQLYGAVSGDLASLHFTSSNIRIWQNADKSGGQVYSDTTTFDPTQSHTVYVEGLTLSSAVNAEVITLNWTSGAIPNFTLAAARAEATVYKVTGALNVPGYSRHTYGAILAGAAGWAEFGAITGGTSYTPQINRSVLGIPVAVQVINWGQGEVVGTFKVNAPGGFSTTREVNVVKVELAINGADNQLILDDSRMTQDNNKVRIHATNDTKWPAMQASIKVAKIAGPVRGDEGKRWGQRFIDLGFVQTVTFTSRHSDYRNTNPKVRVTSENEGKSFIDVVMGREEGKPWYDMNYANGLGFRCYTSAVDSTEPLTGILFDMVDNPSVSAVKDAAALTLGGDHVDFFSILFNFNISFVVHTKDTDYDANDSYTIRASVPWSLNASGEVSQDAAHTWQRSLPENQAITTTANPKKFTESQACEIIPTTLTKGSIGNEAARTGVEKWTQNNYN